MSGDGRMTRAGGGTCACPERAEVGAAPQGPDTCAVIVAGGVGARFRHPGGKQFVEVCGLPLVCWTILAFDRAPSVGQIVVVIGRERLDDLRGQVLERVCLGKPVSVAFAGETRQDSVYNGLQCVPASYPLIAVHDGARPLIKTATIEKVIAAVRADPRLAGAICATPSIDTLKFVDGRAIIATPDRSMYWAAQTPQVFRSRALTSAYKAARWEGYVGTDDSSLVERHGGTVACVEGPRDNIKVTVPEDLAVVEAKLRQRLIEEGCGIDAFGRDMGAGGGAAGGPSEGGRS